MNTFSLVRPEHLNHQGYLFGGQLLKWVDEYTWLVASRDFPKSILVTRAMDSVEFRQRVGNGSILRFSIMPHTRGKTSTTYRTEVHASEPQSERERVVFTTHITFVAVDKRGRKVALPARKRLPSRSL